MLEKIVTFEVALFPILSLDAIENLIKFLFCILHRKKTIPVYIPTHLVISFTRNPPSFTKCSRVRK